MDEDSLQQQAGTIGGKAKHHLRGTPARLWQALAHMLLGTYTRSQNTTSAGSSKLAPGAPIKRNTLRIPYYYDSARRADVGERAVNDSTINIVTL